MSDWLDTLLQLRAAGTPAVVVTVASTKGSAPRETGTKMIVTPTDVHGTIGGGHLEHKAIAIARDQLAAGRASDMPLRRFPLGASLGQCCGGLVNLLFEPLAQDAPWLDAVANARRGGHDSVVVTAIDGDTTLDKLVVTREQVTGSLDANLDRAASALARALLADGGEPRLATIGVDCHSREGGNQVSSAERRWAPACAGATRTTLFLEPIRATDFDIVLFGAGHVGRALVRTLAELPCRITWVDERETEFPRDIPANVTVACTDAPEAEVDAARPGAYFLVMTHSHALVDPRDPAGQLRERAHDRDRLVLQMSAADRAVNVGWRDDHLRPGLARRRPFGRRDGDDDRRRAGGAQLQQRVEPVAHRAFRIKRAPRPSPPRSRAHDAWRAR